MYLIILFISAVRTVAQGHHLVAKGWALFEKTCSEVGAGELPQLLRYVKQATTPIPTPTGTPTPTKMEQEEDMEVKASTSEAKPLQEKPIHVTEGGKLFITGAPTATSPPRSPNGVWIPISALTTWICSKGMRKSTSRAFFGVNLG